jgi:hypothetical protein
MADRRDTHSRKSRPRTNSHRARPPGLRRGVYLRLRPRIHSSVRPVRSDAIEAAQRGTADSYELWCHCATQPAQPNDGRDDAYLVAGDLAALSMIGPFSVDMYLPAFHAIGGEFGVPQLAAATCRHSFRLRS